MGPSIHELARDLFKSQLDSGDIAMIENLATADRLNAHRKHRFSEQFHDDIMNLTSSIIHDLVRRRENDSKLVENLNSR